jgi:hypothetical protein
MWISGGNNDLDKNFYWESTGHAFGPYLNWAPAEPDNGATGNKASQHCVILNNTNDYMWHDVDCTANELRFICESKGFGLIRNSNFHTTHSINFF